MTDELLVIHSNTWNHLTLLAYVYKSYISNIYMNKPDLSLNNLQWLVCHKTQPNQNLEKAVCIHFAPMPFRKVLIFFPAHLRVNSKADCFFFSFGKTTNLLLSKKLIICCLLLMVEVLGDEYTCMHTHAHTYIIIISIFG